MKKLLMLAVFVVVWRTPHKNIATVFSDGHWVTFTTTETSVFETLKDAQKFINDCPDKTIQFRVVEFEK